jgi:hypothetical protein
MTVGLPSWQSLVQHMTEELGVLTQDAPGPDGYHILAEYYRIEQGSIGGLRSWMDRHWKVSKDRVRSSRLHRLIVALDFPIIYTTNYDRNIEAAFAAHGREYVKVANARDIAKIRNGITQIIKFHGDFDDDSSLVLTETDYFNRLAFDSPLDVKLTADALGKTVLFVGYSMTHMNYPPSAAQSVAHVGELRLRQGPPALVRVHAATRRPCRPRFSHSGHYRAERRK